MYEYMMPSIDAYHKRKIFHSNEKDQYETTKDWFHRVFASLNGCEFGDFADFMFIDKFIAGVDFEAFQRYAISTKLTAAVVRSMGFDSGDGFRNSIDTIPDHERPSEIGDMLAEVNIKVEVSYFH